MSKIKKLPVARVGEIPLGKAKSFRYGVHNGIAYNDRGEIKAYLNSCTHMGGTVDLVGGCRFRCRVHEAEFDAATGMRCSGQAPEGSRLTPISLEIEGDMIYALYELKE